jgi:hypothetical protein
MCVTYISRILRTIELLKNTAVNYVSLSVGTALIHLT